MKNIVIIVMRYLNSRWSHAEFVEVFGQPDADRLWFLYSDRCPGNPAIFFDKFLTEKQQDMITIRAQMLSMSQPRRNEIEALNEMMIWPQLEMYKSLANKIEEIGHIDISEYYVGTYDFRCSNGIWNTKIVGVSYENNSIFVHGVYEFADIRAVLDPEDMELVRKINKIINTIYG